MTIYIFLKGNIWVFVNQLGYFQHKVERSWVYLVPIRWTRGLYIFQKKWNFWPKGFRHIGKCCFLRSLQTPNLATNKLRIPWCRALSEDTRIPLDLCCKVFYWQDGHSMYLWLIQLQKTLLTGSKTSWISMYVFRYVSALSRSFTTSRKMYIHNYFAKFRAS